MARKLRVEYPGAVYHMMNRGDRSEAIFRDDADRERFLESLKAVCDYVHLNPARARLLKPEQALRGYRWSSWPEYLKAPGKRCPWWRVDRLLGEHRIAQFGAGFSLDDPQPVQTTLPGTDISA